MTRKITPAQLDEIEEAAKEATGAAEPSDWQADVYPVVKRLAAFKGQTVGSVDRLIECDGVYGTMDGRVATHIAMFDPPTVLALIARLREAEAKVERVEAIHRPMRVVLYPGAGERVMEVCAECRTRSGDWHPWPCPTIRALEEEA